jgi:hypothetical protein
LPDPAWGSRGRRPIGRDESFCKRGNCWSAFIAGTESAFIAGTESAFIEGCTESAFVAGSTESVDIKPLEAAVESAATAGTAACLLTEEPAGAFCWQGIGIGLWRSVGALARPILPTRRQAPAWLQPTGTDAASGTGGTAAYRSGVVVVSAKPSFFAGSIFGSVARPRPAGESGAQPSEPANGENGDRMPDGAQATAKKRRRRTLGSTGCGDASPSCGARRRSRRWCCANEPYV